MPVFVPDASVILKWTLPPENEPFADQALALRESLISGMATPAVPSLWYFEVGNTLARKYPETAAEQLRLGIHQMRGFPDLKKRRRCRPNIKELKFLVFPHATRRMIVEIKGFRSGLREFWQLIPKPSLARCLARDLRASPKANSVVFCEA